MEDNNIIQVNNQNQNQQLAVTHLLQHTLRSFCIHENSQWVYAVFWRILPRNYPPPKWDGVGGAYDRSRGNRRNWILVWEDGFCNFGASSSSISSDQHHEIIINTGGDHDEYCQGGLQPDLFFKMSHEIYNYGEGLIGKVAADHSHKWISKDPNDQEINFLSTWNNTADSPRTWEAQFQSGIKTIALIAVREGVIQLGSIHKVIEDLSYVVLLRKKFSYIESIPGVLLPHPSSSAYPFKGDGYNTCDQAYWHFQGGNMSSMVPPPEFYHRYNYNNQPLNITPSMSSLEALLSKLPSVVPASSSPPPVPPFCEAAPPQYVVAASRPMEFWGVEAKEEAEEEDVKDGGECSSSMTSYNHEHYGYHNHDLNVSNCMHNNGY